MVCCGISSPQSFGMSWFYNVVGLKTQSQAKQHYTNSHDSRNLSSCDLRVHELRISSLARFMTAVEIQMYQSVPSVEFNTYWIPCTWFISLLKETRKESRITDSQGLKIIMELLSPFKKGSTSQLANKVWFKSLLRKIEEGVALTDSWKVALNAMFKRSIS
ncbi:unnamed protein product [Timema podura]|uniref:Bestrophin homolog n=1 Tax=Timema podura TaxID=61482 RepID=A0ABN7NWT5_TIMPD|nr:unnamed protein product [Timema podura]